MAGPSQHPEGGSGATAASSSGTQRSGPGGAGGAVGSERAVYEELHATDEFRDLRRRYRAFVFPATVAFLAWYLLYVVLSNWAGGFMSTTLVGNINVGLVFGLLQFVTTFGLAWLYARYANKTFDPVAEELEARFNRSTGRHGSLHAHEGDAR